MPWYHLVSYSILSVILLMTILATLDLRMAPQMFIAPDTALENQRTSCPDQVYDDSIRYTPNDGATVYGYPSAGGVLIRESSALEIVHLGLDRFQDAKRASSASEEDAFCKRLGQMGAKWWWDKTSWIDAMLGEGDTRELAKQVETGWPSSGKGVWVLEYVEDDRDREMKRQSSMLNLCLTMDERCQIIERAGGTFYANPEDCAALVPLSKRS